MLLANACTAGTLLFRASICHLDVKLPSLDSLLCLLFHNRNDDPPHLATCEPVLHLPHGPLQIVPQPLVHGGEDLCVELLDHLEVVGRVNVSLIQDGLDAVQHKVRHERHGPLQREVRPQRRRLGSRLCRTHADRGHGHGAGPKAAAALLNLRAARLNAQIAQKLLSEGQHCRSGCLLLRSAPWLALLEETSLRLRQQQTSVNKGAVVVHQVVVIYRDEDGASDGRMWTAGVGLVNVGLQTARASSRVDRLSTNKVQRAPEYIQRCCV